MATEPTLTHQLILFRGTDWHRGLSPEELQGTMSRWNSWIEDLVNTGKLISGHPLANSGKLVSGKKATVSDGPFAESKEAIGGYLLLKVADFDEAVNIAQNCPALPHGLEVEVRPIVPICPVAQAAQMTYEPAAALA